jgi:hypothetical protein
MSDTQALNRFLNSLHETGADTKPSRASGLLGLVHLLIDCGRQLATTLPAATATRPAPAISP